MYMINIIKELYGFDFAFESSKLSIETLAFNKLNEVNTDWRIAYNGFIWVGYEPFEFTIASLKNKEINELLNYILLSVANNTTGHTRELALKQLSVLKNHVEGKHIGEGYRMFFVVVSYCLYILTYLGYFE